MQANRIGAAPTTAATTSLLDSTVRATGSTISPKDANFNRGAYRAMEADWAKAVGSGKRVFVDIVPYYRGTSMRPYKLRVISTVDGKRAIRNFPNERAGQ